MIPWAYYEHFECTFNIFGAIQPLGWLLSFAWFGTHVARLLTLYWFFKNIFFYWTDSKMVSTLSFTSCNELRAHGVSIPGYFRIKGVNTYCSNWSKFKYFKHGAITSKKFHALKIYRIKAVFWDCLANFFPSNLKFLMTSPYIFKHKQFLIHCCIFSSHQARSLITWAKTHWGVRNSVNIY